MNEQIIIAIGIVILGGIWSIIKFRLDAFIKENESRITAIEKTLQTELGQAQYDKDVQIIKNAVNALNQQKNSITVAIASQLAKELATKVSVNENEILDIITQIIKGIL